MKVLSLFDGMACGMLAFKEVGIEIESYNAYEIDKYAIKTATHNFPNIKERGDVFTADFTQYKGVDFVIGGSPCTYWSIAQKNNRETEASGLGWELFQQYVRAIKEAEPKYFIYENNKSMSAAIRESINNAFGFEAVYINSALVSAQNRQRLYWVGKRNADGSYSKVDVKQPSDRGLIIRDILDDERNVLTNDKGTTDTVRVGTMPQLNGTLKDNQATRIYGIDGKSVTLSANGGGWGAKTGLYAVPVCHNIPQEVTVRKYTCDIEKLKELLRESKNKTNKEIAEKLNKPLTLVEHWFRKDNCFSVPDADIWFKLKKLLNIESTEFDDYVTVFETREGVFEKSNRCYDVNGKMSTLMTTSNDNIIAPVKVGEIGNGGQGNRIYSVDGKSVAQTAASGGIGSNTGLYAIPTDKPMHEVKNGLINIKGKQYPIKLADGYYIIRKLTVPECKRLQTVPEWYVFPVSDAQAYKMLGNGWTILVIAHLIRAALNNQTAKEETEQISIFDVV